MLLALGVLGFGCYQILWTTGLTQISAGDSALLVAASPVLTALLAAAVGMDRLSAPKLAGALIAFGGVAVVIARVQALSLGSSLLGDALTLGAAVLWAVYTVGASRVLRGIDPLQATTWTVVARRGAAGAARRRGGDRPPARRRSRRPSIVAILYSGMLAAGIANVFVLNAIRFVGPTRATAMQFLVPAGAVVLGAVFLAEPIGPAQVIGGAVIVLGVWLTRRPSVAAERRCGPGYPRPHDPPSRAVTSTLPDPPRSSVLPPAPVPPLLPGQPPLAILVDYDGTIARTDVSDALMAEFVTADWESHVADYDAGSHRLAAADGLGGGADHRRSGCAAGEGGRPAARPVVPAVRRAGAGGRHPGRGRLGRVRVLHRAGARGARRGPAAGRDGGDDVRRRTGRGSSSRTATPTASCAAPASATGCSRTRPPGGRWCSSGTGRRTATRPGYSDVVFAKDSLEQICLAEGWPFTRWTAFSEIDAWLGRTLAAFAADPSSLPGPRHRRLFCGAEVWGPGRFDPA